MDKIEKALQKLTDKERVMIAKIITALLDSNVEGLHILKLKCATDIFRVRKGSLRVIYQKTTNDEIVVLAIERRNEKTYKSF